MLAIGARSVENQQHRLTASGVNSGRNEESDRRRYFRRDSIIAAQHGHTFLYRGWEESDDRQSRIRNTILRGYVDKFGRNIPELSL